MTSDTFRCGHPRTPANSYGTRKSNGRVSAKCRLCETMRRRPFHVRLAELRAGWAQS